MRDGEYAQFIQVDKAVLAVDKIVRVDLYHETRYESDGRIMMPARLIIGMSNGDTYVINRNTDEGLAFEEWLLNRTHVLAPMKPAEQEAS